METRNLEATKSEIMNQLKNKQLLDRFAYTILDRIEPNSSLEIYCHKCKDLSKLDFIQFDANLMMHCNMCGVDIMDLDSELYSLVHYNCIKKKAEQYE